MGCHHDALARLNARCDVVGPEGQNPIDRELQRLRPRQRRCRHASVERIVRRVPLVRDLDLRGWDVEAPTPDLHLRIAVFGSCVGLIQTLQPTVVALVQAPCVHNRHRKILGLRAHRPGSLNRAPKNRSEDDVEFEALLFEAKASICRLPLAVLAQVDIGPTGKDIRHVPEALSMADENDLVGLLALDRAADEKPALLVRILELHLALEHGALRK
mmetsp:Transcript_5567/g.12236  ORF Transcript_5567/g.12236 Transcript_5567/m.12236 type:complete len:215 (-) Transcript_5567:90-734(-)